MQESLTKGPKEALIEEESSTNSYSDQLRISETTKHSKVNNILIIIFNISIVLFTIKDQKRFI